MKGRQTSSRQDNVKERTDLTIPKFQKNIFHVLHVIMFRFIEKRGFGVVKHPESAASSTTLGQPLLI
jgi:hypothetical protein